MKFVKSVMYYCAIWIIKKIDDLYKWAEIEAMKDGNVSQFEELRRIRGEFHKEINRGMKK